MYSNEGSFGPFSLLGSSLGYGLYKGGRMWWIGRQLLRRVKGVILTISIQGEFIAETFILPQCPQMYKGGLLMRHIDIFCPFFPSIRIIHLWKLVLKDKRDSEGQIKILTCWTHSRDVNFKGWKSYKKDEQKFVGTKLHYRQFQCPLILLSFYLLFIWKFLSQYLL